MNDKLRPCPFCGSDAQIQKSDSGMFVCCLGPNCLCALGENYDRDAMPDHAFYDEDVSIAAWNQRVDPVKAQLVEALKMIASRTCSCHSTQDEDWHADHCQKRIARKALADAEAE